MTQNHDYKPSTTRQMKTKSLTLVHLQLEQPFGQICMSRWFQVNFPLPETKLQSWQRYYSHLK